jgi:hypothetical protein
MSKIYSDCSIISIRFPEEQLTALNGLAVDLGLPRNTVLCKAFAMILEDIQSGRKLFDHKSSATQLRR